MQDTEKQYNIPHTYRRRDFRILQNTDQVPDQIGHGPRRLWLAGVRRVAEAPQIRCHKMVVLLPKE